MWDTAYRYDIFANGDLIYFKNLLQFALKNGIIKDSLFRSDSGIEIII